MRDENLKILLIILTILFFVNFISASDSQLYQSCGGDNQTTIGCLGDSQFSFTGYLVQSQNQTNQTLPSLLLTKPENGTYLDGSSIPLQYSASNADYVWYNLDSGNNKTLKSNTKINGGQGEHTFYIYANNSYGLVSQSVSFNINNTKFKISSSKYSNSTGNSTDFNSTTYEDIQNLPHVVLENTSGGKIQFNNAINLTNSSFGNNEIDLDSYTNISQNYIFINSTALPNLNISATLSLYDLTFVNPQILMDGSLCPASVCTQASYSGGDLVFNVTHFSAYSAQENPSSSAAGTANNNALTGQLIIISPTPSFSINPNELSVTLSQGEVKTEQTTITNNRNIPINIQLHPSSQIQSLVRMSDQNFTLNSGESKTISIDFIATEDLNPDLYVGKIQITSNDGTEQDLFIAMNVQSKGALLDVSSSIPAQFQQISPGDSLLAQINLFNLGSQPRVDVSLEYIIKDFNGTVIIDQNETVAVQTQAGFVRTFVMPPNADYGKYLLYVRAVYNGQVASASSDFEIVNISTNEKIYIIIIVGLVIIIAGFIGYIITRRIKRRYKQIKRIGLEDLIWK